MRQRDLSSGKFIKAPGIIAKGNPVLEVAATVEPFANGRDFSVRMLRRRLGWLLARIQFWRSGHWLLPLFIKETSTDGFFWKCSRRSSPLGARRDPYHSPIAEAREKQVVERGEFFFMESMTAV
jgi:hypothetical protein